MVFLRVLFSVIFLSTSLAFPTTSWARSVSANSAIFSNSTKVKRLYGKDVHKRVLPASTTKVMTALLVLEKLPLDKWVRVSNKATRAQPSKLGMRPGDYYQVKDLLYAIMLKSANDAAIVLAEAVAGSHWKFVEMMNARAKKLGANNTRFMNANGLPTKSRQYTTAYDMYLIFRQALKHSFFKNLISHRYRTIKSKRGRSHRLKTHNKSLFLGWKHNIYGKTGWTRAAKACFVGWIPQGDDVLIIAVFGCSRRWEDVKHIIEKYGGIDL